MLQLFWRFLTREAYAVRAIRVAGVAVGWAMQQDAAGIPEDWRWVGWIVAGVGAAVTGTNDTPSGIPNKTTPAGK